MEDSVPPEVPRTSKPIVLSVIFTYECAMLVFGIQSSFYSVIRRNFPDQKQFSLNIISPVMNLSFTMVQLGSLSLFISLLKHSTRCKLLLWMLWRVLNIFFELSLLLLESLPPSKVPNESYWKLIGELPIAAPSNIYMMLHHPFGYRSSPLEYNDQTTVYFNGSIETTEIPRTTQISYVPYSTIKQEKQQREENYRRMILCLTSLVSNTTINLFCAIAVRWKWQSHRNMEKQYRGLSPLLHPWTCRKLQILILLALENMEFWLGTQALFYALYRLNRFSIWTPVVLHGALWLLQFLSLLSLYRGTFLHDMKSCSIFIGWKALSSLFAISLGMALLCSGALKESESFSMHTFAELPLCFPLNIEWLIHHPKREMADYIFYPFDILYIGKIIPSILFAISGSLLSISTICNYAKQPDHEKCEIEVFIVPPGDADCYTPSAQMLLFTLEEPGPDSSDNSPYMSDHSVLV